MQMMSSALGKNMTPIPTKRRKLLRRSPSENTPPVRLTERDLAIIDAVYTYRALTTNQIQQLLFPVVTGGSVRGRLVHCQHRLKLLYHNGYLTRDERPTKLSEGRQALIYFLDKLGAQAIAAYRHVALEELDWRPRDNTAGASHLFLDHLLHTNDVRIALQLAAATDGWDIVRWLDDRTLRRREMKEYVALPETGEHVAIVPDGFFSLARERDIYHHFIEADLATVVGLSSKSGRRDWARKVRAYLAYFQSGQYAKRYKAQSFRVLTVTTGAGRLENLLRITEEAGGKSIFWFTTYEALSAQPFVAAPIWSVANREGLSALIQLGERG
jgi:hypothetical protein